MIAKKAAEIVEKILDLRPDDDRERLLKVCLSLMPWKLTHEDYVLGWQGAVCLLWPQAPNTLNSVFVPLDVLILRTSSLLDTIAVWGTGAWDCRSVCSCTKCLNLYGIGKR